MHTKTKTLDIWIITADVTFCKTFTFQIWLVFWHFSHMPQYFGSVIMERKRACEDTAPNKEV